MCAATVRRRQEHEVAGFDDPGDHAERHTLGREGRATGEQPRRQPGRHDAATGGKHPDRRGAERIAGRLEPDVPGDVEDGRDDD